MCNEMGGRTRRAFYPYKRPHDIHQLNRNNSITNTNYYLWPITDIWANECDPNHLHELWAEQPLKFISMKLTSTARLLTCLCDSRECVIFFRKLNSFEIQSFCCSALPLNVINYSVWESFCFFKEGYCMHSWRCAQRYMKWTDNLCWKRNNWLVFFSFRVHSFTSAIEIEIEQ